MSESVATFGTLFSVAAGIGGLACAVWWFIRKRRRELRMPIVRILEMPQTKLPKVVLRKPPIIPFLAFCLGVAAFVMWMAEPRILGFANHEPKQLRVHVFVDMSPSVSAHLSAFDLAKQVTELWQNLKNVSRVTMSTSHADTIYDIQDGSKVEGILQGLAFHRAGTQIGSSIKRHLLQAGEIDRLIVVSDRDQASWSGFQWKYLSGETDVVWYNVTQQEDASGKSNTFINGVRVVSPPGATTIEWDIDISQGGVQRTREGSLRSSRLGETLASTSWKIGDGSRSVTAHLSWPAKDHLTRVQASGDGADREPIVWEITPDGEDAIEMDNTFRTTQSGRGGTVRLVAEPSGEIALEDPGAALQLVLRVLGVQAERVDSLRPDRRGDDAPKPSREPTPPADLWILMGGLGRGLDTFCPRGELKNVWVVPWSEDIDHEELCSCTARILKIANAGCQLVHSREEWINWQSSQGAKQVGGTIGQLKEAVAFAWAPVEKTTQQTELLGLTLPLKPSATFGISHGRFPILVRQLYFWKSLGSDATIVAQATDWPRVADIVSVTPNASEPVFAAKSRVAMSNVPLGESLLATETPGNLPRQWNSIKAALSGRGPGKLDNEDPLPWIKAAAGLLALATVGELIWLAWRRRARKLLAAAGIAFAAFAMHTEQLSAQVAMDFYRVPGAASMSFSRLTREVASRTSIEMSEKGNSYDGTNQKWIDGPWLWTRSPEGLVDSSGGMNATMVRWLKRGGFLVIESNGSEEEVWDRFVQPLKKGTFRPIGWNPVPQDHEMMRSFYLLATLPSCGGQLWRWYSIDGRLAILQAPYHFSAYLQDQSQKPPCDGVTQTEYQTRVFVNLLMVALTTDYKRDQIHLPEILKRLRSP